METMANASTGSSLSGNRACRQFMRAGIFAMCHGKTLYMRSLPHKIQGFE